MRIMLVLLGVAVLVVAGSFTPAQSGGARALVIESAPVRFAVNDPDAISLGKLKWRGTLRLTSDDKDFGGLSGLIVSNDGARFLAITDAAHWVTGTLSYKDGRLSGAKGDMITPMLDADGNPMTGKQGDAEGLDAPTPNGLDGPIFVSFEGKHRIWSYGAPKGGQRMVTSQVELPDSAKAQSGNGGLEALAALSPTRLLAISEGSVDDRNRARGWVLGTPPDGPSPLDVAFTKTSPFAVTDAKIGPDGALYILERRFSRETGVGFQVRRAPSADIAMADTIEGEVLAHLGMSFVIDNMEGLSARIGDKGETLIYLVSDDNFNTPLQQTLIMMFEVTD